MDVSPTGLPRIPPKVASYISAGFAVLALVIPFLPEHTVGFKVMAAVLALGSALGIASPGARKAPSLPEAQAKGLEVLKGGEQ